MPLLLCFIACSSSYFLAVNPLQSSKHLLSLHCIDTQEELLRVMETKMPRLRSLHKEGEAKVQQVFTLSNKIKVEFREIHWI
jgi:hypothetical protein